MACCINCFESSYLSQIIVNNKQVGDCDYCDSKDVNIFDPTELIIFFRSILDLYVVDLFDGQAIQLKIVNDFPNKIFSAKVIENAKTLELLTKIFQDEFEYNEIFENPVKLKYDQEVLDEVIIRPLALSWDNFSDEIININRFHFVNNLDLDKLKSLFKHFEKPIIKGKKFYRARICKDSSGYAKSDMKNPPKHLARGGRANPEGISYLYLANDVDTTLYEARASLYDYVSIGTFRLEESIRVINLSKLTYDVFYLSEKESLEEVIVHSSFIEKLELELSKPRRKNDSELDYLPTQYLSELIKSMGFDGIEYKSSLNSKGYNLAVFYPDKFKCIKSEVYDIDNIQLDYTKIV